MPTFESLHELSTSARDNGLHLDTGVFFKRLVQIACGRGCIEFVAKFIKLAYDSGLVITRAIGTTLLSAIAKSDNVVMAAEWEVELHRMGIEFDIYIYNVLLHCYARSNRIADVERVENEASEAGIKWDAATFTILIRTYGRAQKSEALLRCVNSLRCSVVVPDTRLCMAIVQAFSSIGYFAGIRDIENIAHEASLWGDVGLVNMFIMLYKRARSASDMARLQTRLIQSNVSIDPASCTAMIELYSKEGRTAEIGRLCDHVFPRGLPEAVMRKVVQGLCKHGHGKKVEVWVAEYEAKYGVSYPSLHSAFIAARPPKMHSEIPGHFQNLTPPGISLNAAALKTLPVATIAQKLMSAQPHLYQGDSATDPAAQKNTQLAEAEVIGVFESYANEDKSNEMLTYMNNMRANGILPTSLSYSTILFTFMRRGNLPRVIQFYEDAKKHNVSLNPMVTKSVEEFIGRQGSDDTDGEGEGAKENPEIQEGYMPHQMTGEDVSLSSLQLTDDVWARNSAASESSEHWDWNEHGTESRRDSKSSAGSEQMALLSTQKKFDEQLKEILKSSPIDIAWDAALELFDEMATTSGCATSGGFLRQLLKVSPGEVYIDFLINRMDENGVTITSPVASSLVKAFLRCGCSDRADKYIAECATRNIQLHGSVFAKAIEVKAHMIRIEGLAQLEAGLRRCSFALTTDTYADLLKVYCAAGKDHEVTRLFEEMLSNGVTPTPSIITHLSNTYRRAKNSVLLQQAAKFAEQNNIQS